MDGNKTKEQNYPSIPNVNLHPGDIKISHVEENIKLVMGGERLHKSMSRHNLEISSVAAEATVLPSHRIWAV